MSLGWCCVVSNHVIYIVLLYSLLSLLETLVIAYCYGGQLMLPIIRVSMTSTLPSLSLYVISPPHPFCPHLLHCSWQFWFSWRHQIPEFSKDYYVVAIDMRGYGDTQRPPNKTDYTIEKLTQDIVMLIQELGYSKCTLVAHDWGGVFGW